MHVETEAGEVSSTVCCYWLALDFIDGFSRQPRETWEEGGVGDQ